MTDLERKPWYLHYSNSLFQLSKCRTVPQKVLIKKKKKMYFVSRGPARARTMAYFGEGKGPIHVDNVKCTGSERSLADCIKQDIGTHNCRHSEDAGVICDHLGKKVPGNSNKGEVLFWAVDEHVQVGNCHSRKRWNPTITPYRGDSYMKWINRNKNGGKLYAFTVSPYCCASSAKQSWRLSSDTEYLPTIVHSSHVCTRDMKMRKDI